MCDWTHSYVWHDSFICVTRLIYTCDTTHSYVWHDSSTRVKWLIHMCDVTLSYVWHDAFMRVIGLVQMCDMTRSYVTWLNHMGHLSHSHVWPIASKCTEPVSAAIKCTDLTWLSHVCDITVHICDRPHSCLWLTPCIPVPWPIHTCDITHPHVLSYHRQQQLQN